MIFQPNLRFPPKAIASNISMLEPIQDNDNSNSRAKIIQIYPCLLKLSRKQESVTDGQTDRRTAAITISPHRYRGGIKTRIAQRIFHKLYWSK